ncbi:hypothetical protein DER45DRAFT_543338 [Fusarium avenaceum]|nr:hypothetical protein DER45DRAFT_543338 [Fusarium avenaceum]
MRSCVFVLAIGLLAADSALAGPCQPRRSTSDGVTVTSAATSEISTTVLGTSTNALSETTTATVITTTTDVATTTTVVADATTTTSEAEIPTSIETTTSAPGPAATYSVVVSGGPIDGAIAQGTDQDGSIIIFNPNFQGGQPRSYTLETATGRLRDVKSGNYICAYYDDNATPTGTAEVANCQSFNTGDDMPYNYLNCKIVNSQLSCIAALTVCTTDDNTSQTTCTTPQGNVVLDKFYYQHRAFGGDFWFISGGSPNGYTAINVAVVKQ